MSYPGGGQGSDPYGYQIDPFNGRPIPSEYGTTGYQQAPPIEQQPVPGIVGYPGYSGYPGGPGKPPRKKSAILPIALGAILLLVLAGVGAALVVTATEDERLAKPPITVPSPVPPTDSVGPPPATTAPKTVEDITVPAVTPGWTGVLSLKENVAYDVPKDWKVESPGMLVGFEDSSGPRTIMHGVATYQEGACADVRGSYRGRAGFMTAGKADPERAAPIAAILWAEAAAEIPKDSGTVEPSEATEVKVARGKLTAWTSSAMVDIPPGMQCPAPRVKVTAVAFTPARGADTAMFIMYTDIDVRDELSGAVAKKIIASLRPHQS